MGSEVRLPVTLLPLDVLMEMAGEVVDGEPLLPRLTRVAEWRHWREDPRLAHGVIQTLVCGAQLFLAAAGESEPIQYLQNTQEFQHLRTGELDVAHWLVACWRGVEVSSVQRPRAERERETVEQAEPAGNAAMPPRPRERERTGRARVTRRRRGPAKGSHRGVPDDVWDDLMRDVHERRRKNTPWKDIVAQHGRWAQRTLEKWYAQWLMRYERAA